MTTAALILFSSISSWACSYSVDSCTFDNTFYRAKILEIKSTAPEKALKVTAQDKYTSNGYSNAVLFENISNEPIYALVEEDFEATPTFAMNGKRWAPFKLMKGQSPYCRADSERTPKNLHPTKLESQVVWDCAGEIDSCEWQHNQHPIEQRVYTANHEDTGLAAQDRKPPPSEKKNLTQHFLVNGRVETVEVFWTLELNDKYLASSCNAEIEIKPCAGQAACTRLTRMMDFAKSYGWDAPIIVTTPNYKIELRPPLVNRKTLGIKAGTPSKKVARDIREVKSFVGLRPKEIQGSILSVLNSLDEQSKGARLPIELVTAKLANEIGRDGRVFELKVQEVDKTVH